MKRIQIQLTCHLRLKCYRDHRGMSIWPWILILIRIKSTLSAFLTPKNHLYVIQREVGKGRWRNKRSRIKGRCWLDSRHDQLKEGVEFPETHSWRSLYGLHRWISAQGFCKTRIWPRKTYRAWRETWTLSVSSKDLTGSSVLKSDIRLSWSHKHHLGPWQPQS